MTPNLLYAVGTLATWAGIVFALRSVYFLVRVLMKSPSDSAARLQGSLASSAIVGAICFVVGVAVPVAANQPIGLRLPLVWFVLPLAGWFVVFGLFLVFARLFQAWMAISPEDRKQKTGAAGVWFGLSVLGLLFLQGTGQMSYEVITGGIPLTPTVLGGLLLLSVGTMAVIAVSESAARSRGIAKSVAAQLALIAGSVVFGLPFAFLVITSFKEDRDMSSANGIVWIPKVSETVPYMDPKEPLYEGQHNGQTIQGEVIESRPDGTVKVDIFKPLAIRGTTFETRMSDLKPVPRMVNLVSVTFQGKPAKGMVVSDLDDGRKVVRMLEPASVKDKEQTFNASAVENIRHEGLRWENYTEAISFLPPEAAGGLVYLRNSLILVVFSVLGTILSSSLVAYAFSRMRFPGRDGLFALVLSTMMLPAAVTMLPQFLIFRSLGWIDTLLPLWVPAFFGSAFNIFLLRQFFKQIPMELEDASKIDGCTYLRTFWEIMLPQIKPALAVIAVWTFVGAWNNFMGPLIYVNSPENMPISYALNLFRGERSGEPGMLMAFTTLTVLPVLGLFFFAQKYFIEGVTLSGLGGR